jgi:hypothetical protein
LCFRHSGSPLSGDVVPPSDHGVRWSASHVKAVHPGQIHFLRLRKIASRDEPVNTRDLRPRSITVLGELITTRRTWPIMDATIASNGSIATPAVVSHRRELFWCGETRRWLVVDSPTSPTYPSSVSCWWCGLNRRSSPTTSCVSPVRSLSPCSR